MKPNADSTNIIAKTTAVLSLFALLVSILTNVFNLVDNEQGIHILAIAAFSIYFFATMWLAFGAEGIKQSFRWTSLISLYAITIIFSILVGTWIDTSSSNGATFTKPANAIETFDFEKQSDLSIISLGICNNSASTVWYENCYEAKEKLTWGDVGYNSLHSLGSKLELLPDKQQVYSFRWQLKFPLTVQSVSAKIFIPEDQSVYLINLAAWTKDGTEWKTSGLYLSRSGWFQLWLDMQNGSTTDINAITELHIDLYLPQSSQQTKSMEIKIDDIEFFYPSSTEYKASP